MAEHCADNGADRKVGAYWEKKFGEMAAEYGKVFSFQQIGRSGSALFYLKINGRWRKHTLPDVVIWSSPGEHHEIKHKAPTANGRFGLEVYRFDALMEFATVTNQSVMYTIHNHALAGGRDIVTNNIAHWITADVRDLDGQWNGQYPGYSWVNGQKTETEIYYWDQDLWQSLESFWVPIPEWLTSP